MLTATPAVGHVFAGWGGICAGAGTAPTCSVTVPATDRVIAYFRSPFKAVAVGQYHTCALKPSGNIMCWGRNSDGQLGNGTGHFEPSQPPVQVKNVTNAVAIVAGGYHTCALIGDGTVQCWGNNDKGQLGINSNVKSDTPATVHVINQIVAITAGGYHTCAIRASGYEVFCWGYNSNGQLGDGTTTDRPEPVQVYLGGLVRLTKNMTAGGFHTCAIVWDMSVTCWGMNNDGQLGIGHTSLTETTAGARVMTEDPITFTPTGNMLSGRSIAASIGVGQLFAAQLGGYHTAALDAGGAVWGWGNNNDGQTGLAPVPAFALISKTHPLATGGIHWAGEPPGFLKIAAGAYHTCMSAPKGGVFCIGNNNDGQSGPSQDVAIPTTEGAVDLAAGGFTTCAVLGKTSDPAGTVACWGNNEYGQVNGDANNPARVTLPVMLTGP
jgi:alpha-tubulin suppressor-like RCC1 family protein